MRSAIGDRVKCLGFPGVDEERNERVGKEKDAVVDIGLDGGKKILVCRTDEQVMFCSFFLSPVMREEMNRANACPFSLRWLVSVP